MSRQSVDRVKHPVRARSLVRELNPKPRAIRLLKHVHVVLSVEDVDTEPLQFLDGIVGCFGSDFVQHVLGEFFVRNCHKRFYHPLICWFVTFGLLLEWNDLLNQQSGMKFTHREVDPRDFVPGTLETGSQLLKLQARGLVILPSL